MRRGNKRKFGLVKNKRANLYRSLATALIDHGRIQTTSAKTKSLSSYISKLITIAKKQDLASRRELRSSIGEKATAKLFKEIAPSLSERRGGYIRIIRTGRRPSDGAAMAFIEFVK